MCTQAIDPGISRSTLTPADTSRPSRSSGHFPDFPWSGSPWLAHGSPLHGDMFPNPMGLLLGAFGLPALPMSHFLLPHSGTGPFPASNGLPTPSGRCAAPATRPSPPRPLVPSSRVNTPPGSQQPFGASPVDPHPSGDRFVRLARVAPFLPPSPSPVPRPRPNPLGCCAAPSHPSSRVYTPPGCQQPCGAGPPDPHPSGDRFVRLARVAPFPPFIPVLRPRPNPLGCCVAQLHPSSRVYTPPGHQQPCGAGPLDPHPSGDRLVRLARVAPLPPPLLTPEHSPGLVPPTRELDKAHRQSPPGPDHPRQRPPRDHRRPHILASPPTRPRPARLDPPYRVGQALTQDTNTNVTRRGTIRLRPAPAERDHPADPNNPEQCEQATAPTRDTALRAAGLRTPDDDLPPRPTDSDHPPPEVWCTVLERGHYYLVAPTATSPGPQWLAKRTVTMLAPGTAPPGAVADPPTRHSL